MFKHVGIQSEAFPINKAYRHMRGGIDVRSIYKWGKDLRIAEVRMSTIENPLLNKQQRYANQEELCFRPEYILIG